MSRGLFTEGMSWDNHNLRGWHLEHIIGLAMFDLNNPEHLKIALHYKNLRPLNCKENLARPKLMTREETRELCDKYGISLGEVVLKYKD